MTIHEIRTQLAPAEVIERARSFFALAGTPYTAFPEKAGDGYLRLHMDVGEIVIGAVRQGDSTWVRASASRGAHLLTRFLTTLAPSLEATQTVHRRGLVLTRGAVTEAAAARAAIAAATSEPGAPAVPQAA